MQKALLIVVDGYGEGKDYKYNAVTRSDTPFLDKLRKEYPTTLLRADGEHVGLPKGAMGGSEVGHFTIGAGRIVYQSLEEINRSIRSKKFFSLPALKKAASVCKKKDSKLHLLGMISDQGIHAHIDHLFALLDFAKREKVKRVYIHAITDGRDVPERSAAKYIKKIQAAIKKRKMEKVAKIATVIGRYYAMDRDTNFDRTNEAYQLVTAGKGEEAKSAVAAIEKQYKKGVETDYYIEPIVLDKDGLIEKEDAVIFFNYRSDRAKQLTEVITKKKPAPYFVCFGPYSKTLPVLFPPNVVKNNLGETLAKHKLKQLRIAETDKYGHVTFFFNSQNKEPYKGEDRILVPSPKVPSYAEKPEMSAEKITAKALKALKQKSKYDFMLVNFANCDLVGHSGEFEATVIGTETVDRCLSKIVPEALKQGYEVMLTADHGNAEQMRYPNGEACPSHTFNPVIFIYISEEAKKVKLRKGKTLGLKDVAPTVIETMGLKKPKEMTGESLVK